MTACVSLGQLCVRVVKVFADEDRLAIDVTPPGNEPHVVRHVKVPSAKVVAMTFPFTDNPNLSVYNDMLNIGIVLLCSNLDRAMAAAGLRASDIECLPVRKHPKVEVGRMWRDVPLLRTPNIR